MNRYAHLGEVQEQEILNAVKIEAEMYGLVNRLSNGMIS